MEKFKDVGNVFRGSNWNRRLCYGMGILLLILIYMFNLMDFFFFLILIEYIGRVVMMNLFCWIILMDIVDFTFIFFDLSVFI